MKTQLIILIIILSISANAQIKVSGYVETGYYGIQNSLNETYYKINGGTNDGFININEINRYENIIRYDNQSIYTDIFFQLSFKNIYFEQNLMSAFKYDEGYTFTPLEIEYKTRLYYKWKFLAIGAEHMCQHPIINQHNEIEIVTRRMSHDKIFLKFSFGNFQHK